MPFKFITILIYRIRKMLILNKPNHARKQLEKLTFIPQAAEKVEFLADSRAFKTRILQLIHSAKSRIYLTALYFEKDEAGQEILAALYQAKQANPSLEIKILVDWHRAQRGRIGEGSVSSNADWYAEQKAQYHLEQAIEFIDDDELVEITPQSIRIRKKLLTETDRKRANRTTTSTSTH